VAGGAPVQHDGCRELDFHSTVRTYHGPGVDDLRRGQRLCGFPFGARWLQCGEVFTILLLRGGRLGCSIRLARAARFGGGLAVPVRGTSSRISFVRAVAAPWPLGN
jgi:hypothetical protein